MKSPKVGRPEREAEHQGKSLGKRILPKVGDKVVVRLDAWEDRQDIARLTNLMTCT